MFARLLLVLVLAFPPLGTAAGAPVVLVVGDSISAGYGLASGEGWVTLLERRLTAERYPHRVVNASISGDTTAGGRARLPALLKQHAPAIVIIELGGNDALRGQPLAGTRANLDAMTAISQKAGAKVLLVGLRLPPNLGPMYVREFDRLYVDVAKTYRAALVPYLFEGFGENLAMFQPDQIHPTAQAQSRIVDIVWPALKPLLGGAAR